jgi:hypothetical protein
VFAPKFDLMADLVEIGGELGVGYSLYLSLIVGLVVIGVGMGIAFSLSSNAWITSVALPIALSAIFLPALAKS